MLLIDLPHTSRASTSWKPHARPFLRKARMLASLSSGQGSRAKGEVRAMEKILWLQRGLWALVIYHYCQPEA